METEKMKCFYCGAPSVDWNPVTGCTPISPGCAHCYAKRMAKRLAGRCGYPQAPHEFDVTLHPDRLDEPARWRKPSRVFVCSMSDLFHDDVPFEFIDKIFAVMGRNQQHTFQLLTKRPERALKYINSGCYKRILRESASVKFTIAGMGTGIGDPARIGLPNVWFGVTAENQEQADARIPLLIEIPAVVRFVSIEPMLGPIKLSEVSVKNDGWMLGDLWFYQTYDGRHIIDWVICGGETGPGARPMRDQCKEADVPFFFKKHGEWAEIGSKINYAVNITNLPRHTFQDGTMMVRIGKNAAGRVLDGRTWAEYPTPAR